MTVVVVVVVIATVTVVIVTLVALFASTTLAVERLPHHFVQVRKLVANRLGFLRGRLPSADGVSGSGSPTMTLPIIPSVSWGVQ